MVNAGYWLMMANESWWMMVNLNSEVMVNADDNPADDNPGANTMPGDNGKI